MRAFVVGELIPPPAQKQSWIGGAAPMRDAAYSKGAISASAVHAARGPVCSRRTNRAESKNMRAFVVSGLIPPRAQKNRSFSSQLQLHQLLVAASWCRPF